LILCESIFGSRSFREIVATVLFEHFEVPSITFVSSEPLAVLPVQKDCAMIFKCGYSETVVFPIYNKIALIQAIQTLPLASKEINEQIKKELESYPSYIVSESTSNIFHTQLADSVIEDIKLRFCYIQPRPTIPPLAPKAIPWPAIPSQLKLKFLKNPTKSNPHPSQLKITDKKHIVETQPKNSEIIIFDMPKPLHGKIEVRKCVCYAGMEVLWSGRPDCTSIASLILDSLLLVNIYLRHFLKSGK